MRLATCLFIFVALAACNEVTSERATTFVYQGTAYPAVIREFQTGNGSFSRRSIRVRSVTVSCSATDDRDCINALRQRLEFSRS